MPLNTKQLANLTVLIDKALQYSYKQYQEASNNWVTPFCQVIKMTKSEVTLPWIEDIGLLQEVPIGQPPVYEELTGHKTTIALKKFADGIRIRMLDISGDDTGQMLDKARSIGMNAAFLNKDGVIDILRRGDTSAYVSYDSQNYFANVHQKKPGDATLVYDNLMAGALSKTTLQAVRTAMIRFPSDLGTDRPMGLNPSHLIVPSDLEITAREILNSNLINEANKNTDNQMKGIMDYIMEARLSDTDDWYVLCNKTANRPFLHGQHADFSPFSLIAETADTDPAVRDYDEYRWSGKTFEGVAPGHPFLAIKVVN